MRQAKFVLVILAVWMGLGAQTGCRRPGILTEIAKWQDDKAAALSLTYDDGSINQFRVAVPLMKGFGFPATFHIITGEILGSRYKGAFIGRSTEAIIQVAREAHLGCDFPGRDKIHAGADAQPTNGLQERPDDRSRLAPRPAGGSL
jgi:hypothetical protein